MYYHNSPELVLQVEPDSMLAKEYTVAFEVIKLFKCHNITVSCADKVLRTVEEILSTSKIASIEINEPDYIIIKKDSK